MTNLTCPWTFVAATLVHEEPARGRPPNLPAERIAMPNIGPMELIIVLVIVLLIFGPKRLPGLGKQLGSGMREFKDSITGKGGDDDDAREKPDTREQANSALGRPEGETTPIDGEVVSDRTTR